MRASWHGKFLLGNIGFVLRSIALAFALPIATMTTSEAQENIVALNQRVMRLDRAGQKAETIGLAEKVVGMSRAVRRIK